MHHQIYLNKNFDKSEAFDGMKTKDEKYEFSKCFTVMFVKKYNSTIPN